MYSNLNKPMIEARREDLVRTARNSSHRSAAAARTSDGARTRRRVPRARLIVLFATIAMLGAVAGAQAAHFKTLHPTGYFMRSQSQRHSTTDHARSFARTIHADIRRGRYNG